MSFAVSPSASTGKQDHSSSPEALVPHDPDVIPIAMASPVMMVARDPVLGGGSTSDLCSPPLGAEPQIVSIDDPNDFPNEATPLVIPSRPPTGNTDLPLGTYMDEIIDKESNVPHWRDISWGLLWVIHFIAVVAVSLYISPKGYQYLDQIDFDVIHKAMEEADDMTPKKMEEFDTFVGDVNDYIKIYPQRILFHLVLPLVELGIGITFLYTYLVIRPFTKAHVSSSLILSGTMAVLFCFSMLISSFSIVSILLSCIILGAVGYFFQLVWSKVPFAAINLKIAVMGVSSNCGVYILALVFSELGFVWVFFWLYTTFGMLAYLSNECKDPTEEGDNVALHLEAVGGNTTAPPSVNFVMEQKDCENHQGLALLAMLLSLYWTGRIILNTLQVTVSGVMATWCFDKDSAQCWCSTAVISSLYRSLTYSFGSISLGSLFQGIVSSLRSVIKDAEDRRRNPNRQDECAGFTCAFCFCVVDCIANLLEDVLDYINQWAYVFVGIYGHSYIESGKEVMEIFRVRGWTTIVTDDLVGYVLGFTTFLMGMLVGLAALAVEAVVSASFPNGDEPTYIFSEGVTSPSYVFGALPGYKTLAFIIGFLVGTVVASVMMNVLRGAVNTLVVCWADSPDRMIENHPKLTTELSQVWAEIFPDQFQSPLETNAVAYATDDLNYANIPVLM